MKNLEKLKNEIIEEFIDERTDELEELIKDAIIKNENVITITPKDNKKFNEYEALKESGYNINFVNQDGSFTIILT